MRSKIPPLHVVMDDEVAARDGFAAIARRVMETGGSLLALHLRARRASGRRMHGLAAALRPIASETDARLIVNDRADVALAVDADGVQVGARGLSPADARRVIGPHRLLGVSVHAMEEAWAAREGGADFVVAGTIWPTLSHPDRTGAGVGLIREMAVLGIPVIAIGGVTAARAAEARDAGAIGVAVLRGVWDAADPAAAVNEYLNHWKDR